MESQLVIYDRVTFFASDASFTEVNSAIPARHASENK